MQTPVCRFCNNGIDASDNFCRHCGAKAQAAASVETGVDADIKSLIAAGRIIEAVKVIRERTGMGLKEAKDLAENIGRSIGKK